MGKNVLNFPRQLLSALQQAIRAIKGLRGQPDGFVGTDGDGYATLTHLASGTPSAGVVLRGDGTWAAASSSGVIADDVSTTVQNIVAYNSTDGLHIAELTGTQGDTLYYNGTTWSKLSAGTDGFALGTQGASANPRWIPAANGRYVDNVADFTAAVAAMTTGGTIYVAAGYYELTETLTITAGNLRIVGAGTDLTLIHSQQYSDDIIRIRNGNVTLERLTVFHGTSGGGTGNGKGGVGSGRGIVIDMEVGSADNVGGITLREVAVLNTSSWCVYDTGIYAYEDITYSDGFSSFNTTFCAAGAGGPRTAAEQARWPSPIWGYSRNIDSTTVGGIPVKADVSAVSNTTINSKTITSTAAFGDVKVGNYVYGAGIPHGTYVTAKASNSSITVNNKATANGTGVTLYFSRRTNCRLTVEFTMDQVTLAFPNSGGCLFLGYGGTTFKGSGVKTNAYSFGSHCLHNYTTPTDAVTLGHIHFYGHVSGVMDNKPIFQSPGAQSGSPAVPHDDVDATMLSWSASRDLFFDAPYFEVLSTYCEDGIDWVTGGVGLDKDRAGNYIGYRQYWLITGAGGFNIVIDAPLFTVPTRRKDPDEFAAYGSNYYSGYPARIIRTSAGPTGNGFSIRKGLVPNWRLWFTAAHTRAAVAPFGDGDFYPVLENGESLLCQKNSNTTLNSAALFGNINIGDPVYGPGIPIKTYVTAKASSSSLTISQAATDSLNETLRFGDFYQPWDRDDFWLRGDNDGKWNTPIHIQDLLFINWNSGKARDPGIPAGFSVHNRENLRVESHSKPMRLSPFTDMYENNGTESIDNMDPRLAFSTFQQAGMIAWSRGTGDGDGSVQREGLWGISERDHNWRQIPYMRIHPSIWSPIYAGDMWMQLSVASGGVYTRAKWKWYDNSLWVVGVGLAEGTTAAGDLIYYTASDTPARLAIGSARKVLMSVSGAPSWQTPDVDVVGNFLTMGAS